MLFLLATALATETAEPAATTTDISLNRATVEEIAAVEGVSEELAVAVVDLREDRGRFNSVEELRVLPGIGAESLDALRQHSTIDIPMPAKSAKSYKTADEVLSVFDHEPSIQDLHDMAMVYTHTNRDQVERWLAASKNSAFLPELKVKYNYADSFGQDFTYADGGASFDLDDGTVDKKWYAQAEVKWKLDDLVMNSERIRVISETQDVVKLRDKVLSEVTRLYFDRRRLQVDLLLNPPGDVRAQVENQLRLMELTAELDAYTGGAFSAAVTAR